MARHSSIERVGIHKIGLFFEENFNWIFREQSVSDVGIDALLEKSTNGQPKGDFLALQIKSGTGNFHKTAIGYTYYISEVHYYYWINLSLPVILLGYIPEDDSIYWQEITESTISKTNTRWKVNLPFEQKLTLTSLKSYNLIIDKSKEISKKKRNSKTLSNAGRDKYILLANSLEMIRYYQEILVKELNTERDKITFFKSKKKKDKNQEAILKSNQYSILKNFSNRILMEIEIFAEMNSEFVISTDIYIESKWNTPLFQQIAWKKGKEQMKTLIDGYKGTAESMNNILEGLKTYKKKDIFQNKESISLALEAVEKIKHEFFNASIMWEQLNDKWKFAQRLATTTSLLRRPACS